MCGQREDAEEVAQETLLRGREELSTGETSRILGLTQDVVKTRLHRTRLALPEKLEQFVKPASESGTAGSA